MVQVRKDMRRSLMIPIILELLIFGGLLATAVFMPTAAGCAASGNLTQTQGSGNTTVQFTIYESDTGPMEGMNGSAYHGTSNWPVIQVHLCQTVTILVKNVNSSEPHGFAIDHYFDELNGASNVPGVELNPGQSFTVQFVADELGTFRMYCSVFCAIHPLMQNGQLIVSS